MADANESWDTVCSDCLVPLDPTACMQTFPLLNLLVVCQWHRGRWRERDSGTQLCVGSECVLLSCRLLDPFFRKLAIDSAKECSGWQETKPSRWRQGAKKGWQRWKRLATWGGRWEGIRRVKCLVSKIWKSLSLRIFTHVHRSTLPLHVERVPSYCPNECLPVAGHCERF